MWWRLWTWENQIPLNSSPDNPLPGDFIENKGSAQFPNNDANTLYEKN
jgi:hypothetical protein